MKVKYSCKIREPGQFFVGDLVVPNTTIVMGIIGDGPFKVIKVSETKGLSQNLCLSEKDVPIVTMSSIYFSLYNSKS